MFTQTPTSEAVTLWHWSVSLSTLLSGCPRAFYFRKTLSEDPSPGGQILPLFALQGHLVHYSLAFEIGEWSKGRPMSETRAERTAFDLATKIWQRKEKNIIEIVNGLHIDESEIERIQNSVASKLKNFFRMLWPHYSNHTYVTHEKLSRLTVGGVDVWLQVDLATRDERKRVIVSDWKTGMHGSPEREGFQMAVYALWARNFLGVPITEIETRVVNLSTGEIDRRFPSPELFKSTEARIASDSMRMRPPYEREEFSPRPDLDACMSCRFLRRCEDGKMAVSSSGNAV